MIRTEVIFECLNWLKKSKEDIISAEVLLDVDNERKKYILASAGFHCQQSIEKSLKAFLILQQVNFRRTHDIDYLLNKCLEKSDLLSNINININTEIINSLAVAGRYPGEYINYEIDEIELIFKQADKILHKVINVLKLNINRYLENCSEIINNLNDKNKINETKEIIEQLKNAKKEINKLV